MYNPGSFLEADDAKLRDFIRAHPFATLVSAAAGGPFVSHIPLYLDEGGRDLVGHVARGNGHWRLDGAESVAIFHGPHAYISASWYEAPDVVPTWNYLAVHVRGALSALEAEETRRVLDRMIAEHEPDPGAFRAGLGEAARAGLERGIVGIRLAISSWEGKWKLSQNKDAGTRARLADRLEAQPGEDARRIARLMREAGGNATGGAEGRKP